MTHLNDRDDLLINFLNDLQSPSTPFSLVSKSVLSTTAGPKNSRQVSLQRQLQNQLRSLLITCKDQAIILQNQKSAQLELQQSLQTTKQKLTHFRFKAFYACVLLANYRNACENQKELMQELANLASPNKSSRYQQNEDIDKLKQRNISLNQEIDQLNNKLNNAEIEQALKAIEKFRDENHRNYLETIKNLKQKIKELTVANTKLLMERELNINKHEQLLKNELKEIENELQIKQIKETAFALSTANEQLRAHVLDLNQEIETLKKKNNRNHHIKLEKETEFDVQSDIGTDVEQKKPAKTRRFSTGNVSSTDNIFNIQISTQKKKILRLKEKLKEEKEKLIAKNEKLSGEKFCYQNEIKSLNYEISQSEKSIKLLKDKNKYLLQKIENPHICNIMDKILVNILHEGMFVIKYNSRGRYKYKKIKIDFKKEIIEYESTRLNLKDLNTIYRGINCLQNGMMKKIYSKNGIVDGIDTVISLIFKTKILNLQTSNIYIAKSLYDLLNNYIIDINRSNQRAKVESNAPVLL